MTAVALVTGATRGIGHETARQLAGHGMRVLLGCRDLTRGSAAADALRADPAHGRADRASVRADPAHVRALVLDVTDPDSIDSAVSEVEHRYGRLDVLVNNAGVNLHRTAPSRVSPALLRATFDTNFFGACAVLTSFLPLLRRSAAGRVVNVSTSVGSLFRLSDRQWEWAQAAAPSFAYSASKAALNVLTVAFANELHDTPVKVNAVDPGYTATELNGLRGPQSVEDAARVVVRYATLPADGPTGGFYESTGRIPW